MTMQTRKDAEPGHRALLVVQLLVMDPGGQDLPLLVLTVVIRGSKVFKRMIGKCWMEDYCLRLLLDVLTCVKVSLIPSRPHKRDTFDVSLF